uniref:Uncharacterized protein n=1 Tax=Rhizophora mucronata TaxID=61149 RepID=A0A2P2N2J6_RHIMU
MQFVQCTNVDNCLGGLLVLLGCIKILSVGDFVGCFRFLLARWNVDYFVVFLTKMEGRHILLFENYAWP